jgi:cytokinesis protein
MTMEETRRRNDASMARKRLNNTKIVNSAATHAGTSADGAMSAASTGAMDSLLEKLRAAAPQARDQRDRRRRARLKDRHQTRVASGQTIPDLGDLTKGEGEDDEVEKKTLRPESIESGDMTAERADEMPAISEGEDVAERAASMLQGLRGDGEADGKPGSRDGSLRVRRRRESADDERRNRRRRRGPGASSTGGSTEDGDITPLSPSLEPESIPEEATPTEPPRTVVRLPSPEGTLVKPLELSD